MDRRLPPALVLLAVAHAGCGKRGDPLPPLPRNPAEVSDFRVGQRGDSLEVSLVAPRATRSGGRLGLLDVEILRAGPSGEFLKLAERRRIRVAPGERVSERLPLDPPGTLVRLSARALVGKDASSLAPVVTWTTAAPPPAPTSLRAQALPDAVRLTFRPAPLPTATPTPSPVPSAAPPGPRPAPTPGPSASPGSSVAPRPAPAPPPRPPLRGTLVYRRAPDGRYTRALTPPTSPLTGDSYEDRAVRFGETWCYVARTMAAHDPFLESADSPEACLEYRDSFAPAAPTGLAVLPRPEAVEVSWSPSPEPDLGGYRVYRSVGGEAFGQIGAVPAGETYFRDATLPPSASAAYRVAAVDQAGNEGPPTPPVEVRRP
jgi:hypothetical protein